MNGRGWNLTAVVGLGLLAGTGYFAAAPLSYAFAIGGGTVTLWVP